MYVIRGFFNRPKWSEVEESTKAVCGFRARRIHSGHLGTGDPEDPPIAQPRKMEATKQEGSRIYLSPSSKTWKLTEGSPAYVCPGKWRNQRPMSKDWSCSKIRPLPSSFTSSFPPQATYHSVETTSVFTVCFPSGLGVSHSETHQAVFITLLGDSHSSQIDMSQLIVTQPRLQDLHWTLYAKLSCLKLFSFLCALL